MNRVYLLSFAAVAALILVALSPQVTHAVPSRPNVVLIQLDDMDTASVQMAVDKGLMPNFKKYFVDTGYKFNNSYVTSTLGSPTRASMLTSQYPHNHGEIGSNAFYGGPPKLNESSTIATWLHNAGYFTFNIGRYITGWGSCEPAKYGFCNPPYVPAGWDLWVAPIDQTTWSTRDYKLYLSGTTIDFGPINNATGGLYDQIDVLGILLAPDVIKGASSLQKPFFFQFAPVAYNREMLFVPPYNVCPNKNDPYFGGDYWGVSERPANRYLNTVYGKTGYSLPRPPSFNEADISDKPNFMQSYKLMNATNIDCDQKRWWRKLELLRTVDDSVGAIMNTLENTSELNNTVVIFTADNGILDGQHRLPEKNYAYEEALRVPMYIRIPDNSVPQVIQNPVTNADIAATIADLTGATPTHDVDGRSLVPLLNGQNTTWRSVILAESSKSGLTGTPDFTAVRTFGDKPRKYVKYYNVTSGIDCELYDMSSDPYEMQNLCSDPARQNEVVALQQLLDGMESCHGDGCRALEENFVLP